MSAFSSLTELLSVLRDRKIRISVEQGDLRLRAPVGAVTDELRQALRERKAELLALFAQNTGAGVTPIPAHPRDGSLPLSAAQRRLWFLEALNEHGPAAYNIATSFVVEGALDAAALSTALDDVIARHEALRTGVRDERGAPVGVLAAAAHVPVTTGDLSAAGDPVAAFREHAAALADARFDLADPPLVRAAIHCLGTERHGVVIVVHHLVADGESMPRLVRELAACYDARVRGVRAELPALRIQYADFAAWQDAADDAEHREYWREVFRDMPGPLELPTDAARPATQSFAGATTAFRVDPEVTATLTALGRASQASLFMTLVAALAAVLERWSGQDDLTIGTPARGRPHHDLEPLVGCFVNTLALRCRVNRHGTFARLLEAVRDSVTSAFDHESYPFDRLVDQLSIPRDTGRSPLFDVMLMLAPEPAVPLELTGLTVTPVDLGRNVSQLDLTISATVASDGGLDGTLQYRTDLFSAARIARLAAHFTTFLSALVRTPARPLREIPSLPEAERAFVVRGVNDTGAPHDTDATLVSRFTTQAARTPGAVAVIDDARGWTYAEIDERSTRVAQVLRARGAGPGARVALLTRRGERMMTGILGIQKSGAAYVPIQPADPERRVEQLLADCAPMAVLREAEIAAIADAPQPPVALPPVSPRDVAYVIYTSGSTGHPKGVEIEHGSAVNRIEWMNRAYGLHSGDVVLQKTPYTFDVSVWELFWWAFSGATVAFLAPDAERDPAAIVDAVARHRVTTMHFVPSMLRAFLDHLDAEPNALARLVSLRDIFASGEALPSDLVARVRSRLFDTHGTRLHNLYGPTEATVDVSFFDCFAHPSSALVPIGAPVANTALYVLDHDLSPAPLGVPGEIFIGGVNVGRGYLGRPDLTADRFVPDPFTTSPGARLYRTGDLGRWRDDGQLEYLGRNDQQVKIRGHRIELGEVESVLLEHPAVHNAAALAQDDVLVAYLSAAPALTVETLRAYLNERLPAAMVPSRFVTVDAWPLTASGKLDRRALLATAPAAMTSAQAFVAPRTPAEIALTTVIARVLGVPRVGAEDDFFALGGHSLLATRVVAEARQAHGLDITLRDVFAHPTVAALAARADAREPFQGRPLQAVPVQAHYPVSHAQRRLWLAEQRAPGAAAYNVAVAFTIDGALDVPALADAWRRLTARHESLRTGFREVAGEPRQWIDDTPTIAIDIADLSAEAFAAEAARLAAQPFDLSNPPLVRMAVRRFGPQSCGWVVVMHHLICDGWSMPVLVRELAAAYTDAMAGRASSLVPLRVQYKDYAAWLQTLLDDGALTPQRDYWRAVFPSAPPRVALPFDTGAGADTTAAPERVVLTVDAATTAALTGIGRQHGASLFMTLTAVVTSLLYRYTGQTDVTIGTVSAGRIHADTEPQIGFYVNTLALRTAVDAASPFTAVLTNVRDRALDAFEHQAYPFDLLVDDLDLPADGRFPLFDVLIVLQNNATADLTLPGLRLTPVALPPTGDKFDLTFHFAETRGELELTLEFRSRRYPRAAIDALGSAFMRLVSAVVADPAQPLDALPLPAGAAREETIAIASTFTAEPLEDTLAFWMAQAHQPAAIRFAPFGQVFQALLDPSSVLGRNRHGVNICLVRLSDWLTTRPLTPLSPERLADALRDHATHTLPAGATVAHLNAYETDDVYQEIFVDRVYERHGITIRDGDVVFDIGANIGLFSLFANASARDVRLFSFEPAPPTFDALRRNTAAYCANARVFHCGIGAADGEAPFTFYPRSSVFSSYHPDHAADAASVRAVVHNVVAREGASPEAAGVATDTLMTDRMTAETVVVPVRSLASVIAETGVTHIDLLKLDAEKSEREILAGLGPADWARIRQLVIEVHDQGDGTLPYVQSLVVAHGFDVIVEEESRLHESGLFTVYGRRPEAMSAAGAETTRDAVTEFAEAVRTAAARTPSVPMLVIACPDAAGRGARDEARLVAACQGLRNVTVVSSTALLDRYPVETPFDARTDAMGAVPYTPAMYAAMATTIARALDARRRPPFKVVALDADQTLWRGVVGEDGAAGITLDPPRQALQTFMRAQRAAGMLLCLVSKNDDEDVVRAFSAHPEMPLGLDDFAARRVNWRPKSENLRALAAELNVGLDSFVFVDDNPLECAEVRAACPEVLTMCLPAAADQIPAALRGAWAFDRAETTAEDAKRADFYAAAGERERLKSAAPTLKAFLDSLHVRIDIAPAGDTDVPRAAQLSQRTNQFNTTTIRRTEDDIRQLRTAERGVGVVRVSDRFGDYGLVGVVSCFASGDALVADAMMLSCRALGRGVEHRMVQTLGDDAAARGLAAVEIRFAPTAKNQPAKDFLDRLPGADMRRHADGVVYRLSTDAARTVTFDPDTVGGLGDEQASEEPAPAATAVRAPRHIDRDLFDAGAIAAAAATWAEAHLPQRKRARRPNVIPPGTAIEHALAGVWSDVLQVRDVGVNENFFDLGGHSLKAIRMLSRAADLIGAELTLGDLFADPTIAGLAAHAAMPVEPIPVAPAMATYPLSGAQRRLWILNEMSGSGSVAYNVPAAFVLTGTLDVHALESAFRTVIDRHESLRTRFVVAGNEPRQEVVAAPPFALERFDNPVTDVEFQRAAEALAHTPLPFDRAPLLAAALHRLDDTRWGLALVVHHVATDGWSMPILVRELFAAYDAAARGVAPSLPPLRVHYKDYAVWQESRLASPAGDDDRAFWLAEFRTAPPALDLPADRARPAMQDFHGGAINVPIDATVTAALRAVGRRHGATLFMTLLAALDVLLYRLTGETDITVGSPITGRVHPDLAEQVGFYVNTLALRTTVTPREPFATLLDRVRDRTAAAFRHQAYPFDRLVDELRLPRHLGRSPLFDVMLVVEEETGAPLQLPGLDVRATAVRHDISRFDVTFHVAVSGAGLDVGVQYSTALFDRERMERLGRQFETLVRALVTEPGASVDGVPVMSAEDRAAMLTVSRGAHRLAPARTLIELFEARAAARPDDRALIGADGETLSYRELDARATAIAGSLGARALPAEAIVAVEAPRSVFTVAAMLGVMKAGGVYLPIDPSLPEERRAFLVRDSGAALVLKEMPRQTSTPRASAVVEPSQLAYVIYTSGSTGQPKGVAVSHAALANMAADQIRAFGLGPGDVFGQFASVSFDASIYETFLTLLSGATLAIVPDEARVDPRGFVEWSARAGATVFVLPPAFVRTLDRVSLPGVRLVITAGEAADPDDARHYAGVGRYVNAYGPTEFAVCATWSDIATTVTGVVPIGRAIQNGAAYVLDAAGEPVPVGQPGELYLGGAGVARGYVGRPDLTAERFVPDPFGGTPGARLYRTGDLARWREDGQLEFIGRNDFQVKVRGHRIELGEVEAALRSAPGVRDAVAIARALDLVAYVAGDAIDVDAVRAALRRRLPDYMTPAFIVALDVLPLNASGKVDRRALPAPEPARTDATVEAPVSALERTIAAAWCAALGRTDVGTRDSFFDLGGNSILLARVLTQLRRDVSTELTLLDLFTYPRIQDLAAHLGGSATRAAADDTATATAARMNERAERQRAALKQRRPGR